MSMTRIANLEQIENEVARIRSISKTELRALWHLKFKSAPPKALTKDILGRACAWHVQEKALGGIDRLSLSLLESYARGPNRPDGARRYLQRGTVLVREYQGERHVVTVEASGLVWRGTSYKSLSAIARAITGTPWNGPRFFGLRRSDHLNNKRKEPRVEAYRQPDLSPPQPTPNN